MLRPKQLVGRIKALPRKTKLISAIVCLVVVAAGATAFIILTHRDTPDFPPSTGEVFDYYNQRLSSLEQSAADQPDDPTAHSDYAVALRATGYYQKAREQYARVVELNPEDPTAHNDLGNILRDLGEYESAANAYKKSLELNSKQLNVYVNLASVQQYHLDDTAAAIATYQQSLENFPEDPTLTLQLALAYERAGDTAQAREFADKLLAADPEHAAAQDIVERLSAE